LLSTHNLKEVSQFFYKKENLPKENNSVKILGHNRPQLGEK
jgi:hypothetical protein